MNGRRFDDLTKLVAARTTRRRLLGGAASTIITGWGGVASDRALAQEPTPTPAPACDPQDDPCCNVFCDSGYFCQGGNCFCAGECCSNADCPWTYWSMVCDQGVCICPYECCHDGMCSGGNVCADARCVPPQTDGCTEIVCTGGKVCQGGACVCTSECCGDGDCASGSCVGGACVSLDACANVACNAPYVCQGGSCVCPAACCANSDCGAGQTCQGGACIGPTQTPTPKGVRYLLLIDGFGGDSLTDPANHGVRDAFAPLAARLLKDDSAARLLYYSYRAGVRIAREGDPKEGWDGGRYETGAEPVYAPDEVTGVRLRHHVAALDWLVADLRTREPGALLDLVGFGLGGVLSLAWVYARTRAEDEAKIKLLGAVRRVALVNTFVGGLNPDLAFAPGGLAGLRTRGLDLGNGSVLTDLYAGGRTVRSLLSAAKHVPVLATENSGDCLISGERVAGMGTWLGKGASGMLSDEQRVGIAGTWTSDDLGALHRRILVGDDETATQAREAIAGFLKP